MVNNRLAMLVQAPDILGAQQKGAATRALKSKTDAFERERDIMEVSREMRGLEQFRDAPDFGQRWDKSIRRLVGRGAMNLMEAQEYLGRGEPQLFDQVLNASKSFDQALAERKFGAASDLAERKFGATKDFREKSLGLDERRVSAAERAASRGPADPEKLRILKATGVSPTSEKGQNFLFGIKPQTMTPYQERMLEISEAKENRAVGEAEAEESLKEEAVTGARDSAIGTAAIIDRAAERILGSKTATGSGPGMAIARFFSPEDRVALEGDLTQLRSRITTQQIADLEKKGVDLGVLSDSDLRMLATIEGAFDSDMRAEDLIENLQRYREIVRKVYPEDIQAMDLTKINQGGDVAIDEETNARINYILKHGSPGG